MHKKAISRKGPTTRRSLSPFSTSVIPTHSLSALPDPLVGGATAFEFLDQETMELLRIFQDGISTWMDLFDHSMTYQREGSRRALDSSLIRESICSLSAKQLELTANRSVWASVAARRYGTSLRLLINACASETADQDEILMATILLASVELLAAPGSDHRRHLSGAGTLVKSRKIDANCIGLDQASFWIFARLDILSGLINECPTVLLPHEWNVSWTEGEHDEGRLGNHMMWLCSRAVNLVFGIHPPAFDNDVWTDLMGTVDAWFEELPRACKGVPTGVTDQFGFEEWWFPVPAGAAAMATYHLTKLLLLGEHRQRADFPFFERDEVISSIQYHATRIGSIGSSKISDSALVQTVQPLYFGTSQPIC
jgi:hypothetical protein